MGQAKSKKKLRAEGKLLRLDIACGKNKREGFTGVDRVAMDSVDVVHDLTKYPWPFKDGSVEEIHCSHYIEHIPLMENAEGKDLLFCFFDELYRLLIPGGKANIIAPWWSSVRSWQDPTHRRPISDATFLYANKGWRVANGLDHYAITCDFDTGFNYITDAIVGSKNEETRSFWMQRYTNVIQDIQAVMTRR